MTQAALHSPARDRVEAIGRAAGQSAGVGCGLALVLIDLPGLLDWRVGYGVLRVEHALDTLERQLAGLLREGDQLLRAGDGEFLVLLPALRHPAESQLAVRRLQRCLRDHAFPGLERGALEHRLAVIHCSAAELAGAQPDWLLQRAYDALAAAALPQAPEGASAARPAVTAALAESLRVSRELPGALDRGEFELWYQPKFALLDGACVGAEGLLRWLHPRGLRAPGSFIAAAERSGSIVALTRAALHMGLQQLAGWPGAPNTHLSLNFSAVCLQEPTFVPDVLDALAIWAVPPARLTIEITESLAMRDVDAGGRLLGALRDAGARVSLDDFGTGYCSLGYLRRLTADELKIDRSFVTGLTREQGDQRLVAGIIDLAHHFGMDVVAEGVEDDATLECLVALGCDIVQGYFTGRPMPPADFQAALAVQANRENVS